MVSNKRHIRDVRKEKDMKKLDPKKINKTLVENNHLFHKVNDLQGFNHKIF